MSSFRCTVNILTTWFVPKRVREFATSKVEIGGHHRWSIDGRRLKRCRKKYAVRQRPASRCSPLAPPLPPSLKWQWERIACIDRDPGINSTRKTVSKRYPLKQRWHVLRKQHKLAPPESILFFLRQCRCRVCRRQFNTGTNQYYRAVLYFWAHCAIAGRGRYTVGVTM